MFDFKTTLLFFFWGPPFAFTPAFTDFVRLEDWRHGSEGPTEWCASMAPEDMIVGGSARQLDATLFSTLRTHRVPSPPLATPVVKLYAIVRNMVNPYDPSDDSPRFQHRVPTAVAAGSGTSPVSRHVSAASSCAVEAHSPSTSAAGESSRTSQPNDSTPQSTKRLYGHSAAGVTDREGELRRLQDDVRSALPVTEFEISTDGNTAFSEGQILGSVCHNAEVFSGLSPPKKQRLSPKGDVPSACSWVQGPERIFDADFPYGKDLYQEDEAYKEWSDFCETGEGEEGGDGGVENHRSCGEKWNVWHHGGDDKWENHVALRASYGVYVNGFTWTFEEYDARLEAGLVSEDPQTVCLPVAPYATSWYEWKPCTTGDDNGRVDEFAMTQTSLTACLSGAGGCSPNQDAIAGNITKNASPAGTDASEEVGSSGDDEGANPKDDHWLVPPRDIILKALESMCEDGDGVTKEVCKVLDHLEGGELATLCHDSLRGGWNPHAGVVDRVKTVLKDALPKMAVNAMDLVKTGTMEHLMTGPNTAKTAGGWDEDIAGNITKNASPAGTEASGFDGKSEAGI